MKDYTCITKSTLATFSITFLFLQESMGLGLPLDLAQSPQPLSYFMSEKAQIQN